MSREDGVVPYPRHLRKSFCKLDMTHLRYLRYEFQMLEEDIRSGVSEKDGINKLVMRMYLPTMFHFAYWGGTKVVRVDKEYSQNEDGWIEKIRSVYESITEKTNRKIFGRRYLYKVPYPTSFVFYEKGDITEGKHIHTLHHFPQRVKEKSGEYLSTFSRYWNTHYLNRGVGRYFWFEEVDSQEKVSRYASKKMSENYQNGWFVVS
jgi:hypothetical protein